MKQEIISLKKYTGMNWCVRNTKKIGMTINYIEELLSLAFNSLVGILRDVRRSAAGLKIIAITAGIKKHKKIKKHDKMVL